MSETTSLLRSSQRHYQTIDRSNKEPGDKVPAWLLAVDQFYRRYSTSIYLENTGSVARDHLANERTFLAWLRTSLSTTSVGIGLGQLFRLEGSVLGRWIGISFILMGIMLLAFACMRFFHTQTSLISGYFPATRGIVIVASTAVLTALGALLFAVIHPS